MGYTGVTHEAPVPGLHGRARRLASRLRFWCGHGINVLLSQNLITLLIIQLSFSGAWEYNNEMFKKLQKETRIQTNIPTSHCYILKYHIAK